MARIVIQIPDNFNHLAQALPQVVTDLVSNMPVTEGGRKVDYPSVESGVCKATAALERAAHADILSALDVDSPLVMIEGREYAKVLRSSSTYYTSAGAVEVMRSLYRESGVRNGKTVDPVSMRIGAVRGGWLPATAVAMAHALQMGTSREAERTGKQLGRLRYSRSAFEDVGHLVGEQLTKVQADVEAQLIADFVVPAEATSVSTSLDRVSVPMEEPLKRSVGRPRKGAPKNPIERNFRMAYCGTMTLHDAEGNALHTIRYGRMPQGDATGMCRGMIGDMKILLAKCPSLDLMFLQDGAHELWNLLTKAVNDAGLGGPIHELVDFWHLVEKLGSAAVVMHGPKEGKAVVTRWARWLLKKQSAAACILAELKKSNMRYHRVGKSKPVHEAITYLENHKNRLNYAGARKRGLPIGSGQVEATCKNLVALRMKRPGARWKERTGEHIVRLRAIALSDRWESAMNHTMGPLRKSVEEAA